MKIQRSTIDGNIACLTLSGDFDAFAANPFLEQIDSIIQAGIDRVAVNLRLVLFINSTAVGCLIKASKRLKGQGGELVISDPSERVQSTFQTLGLGPILKSFPGDEEAARHLQQARPEGVEVPTENAVLVRFKDTERNSALAALEGVPRMVSVEEMGMQFHSPGTPALYPAGEDVKLKFRLPLFRRAYYYDIPSTVRSSEAKEGGVLVVADFQQIDEQDRRSIAQFVRDMRLLQQEARAGE